MGDASFGLLHARPIGDMLTGQEGSYTAPARYCAKCGCKLRMRNHGRLCAPCQAKTEPTPTERAAQESGYRCDWCERPFTPGQRANQRYCSQACRRHMLNNRSRRKRVGIT